MALAAYYKGERIPGGFSSDTKVTQTEDVSTNANYEILSSGTGDNTTRTEGSHKSANLTYNPSISKLTVKDNNGQVGFSVNNRAASRSMTVTESDVTMSGNQYWDGENQSLKTAVNTKVKKEVSNGSTSVTNYFSSPYTLLSALPFGDSSLRLDDGTLFVHKDEQIESTAMVLYNNGIQTYLLVVDSNGDVTDAIRQGYWMLNQVGLAVSDIWRDGNNGWVGSDHSLASVLSSLNTSLANKLKYYVLTSTTLSTPPNEYGIGLGILPSGSDYLAYVSIDVSWIHMQFRANGSNYIACRVKYGNNAWSTWKNIHS